MPILSEPQVSPRYDGKTRSFLVGTDGQPKWVHPVDHRFALGLCTKRRSWRSQPDLGNDLFEIKYLGLPNTQAAVERYVYSASPCDELIANGDVTIVNIAHEATPEGALIVIVDYVNLRLDKNRVQRLTVYP